MSQPANTTPALRLMSYEQWLEANPDMKRKKPEEIPCLACCDKWGNPVNSTGRCMACGNKRTLPVSTYDIYRVQVKKDRANLIKAGIAFVDIAI